MIKEMPGELLCELLLWDYIIRGGTTDLSTNISRLVTEMPEETLRKAIPLLASLDRMRNILSQPQRDIRYFVTMRLIISEFKKRNLDPRGLENILNAKW